MGRKLALIDEDTGEVLQIIATADEMARRAVHKSVMNHISITLGALSDEKITEWVQEAITQRVGNSLQRKIDSVVVHEITKLLNDSWTKQQMRSIAADIIAKRIDISLKV